MPCHALVNIVVLYCYILLN